MKRATILALIVVGGNIALSQTATAALPVCSSSPRVVIDVKQLGGTETYVDASRVMDKHQILYRCRKGRKIGPGFSR